MRFCNSKPSRKYFIPKTGNNSTKQLKVEFQKYFETIKGLAHQKHCLSKYLRLRGR